MINQDLIRLAELWNKGEEIWPVMLIGELERHVGCVEGRRICDGSGGAEGGVRAAVDAVKLHAAVHVQTGAPADHHILRFILINQSTITDSSPTSSFPIPVQFNQSRLSHQVVLLWCDREWQRWSARPVSRRACSARWSSTETCGDPWQLRWTNNVVISSTNNNSTMTVD